MSNLSRVFCLALIAAAMPRLHSQTYLNTANQLLQAPGTLSIRGYGEVLGSQYPHRIGQWDARRFVLFTGYRYSPETAVVTEIEVEHAKEVYLEQAFLQHKIRPNLNFRAGVMLVPMGIINEYHEPTTFHGVERPWVDSWLIPSTWRELGMGFQGYVPGRAISFQTYVINGLKSYQSGPLFNASKGLRGGRQKGSQTLASIPSWVGKLEWAGLRNTTLGAALFVGPSETQVSGKNPWVLDSTQVGIAMNTLDFRYASGPWALRGQWTTTYLTQHAAYVAKTGSSIGSWLAGGYAEAAYQLPVQTYPWWIFVRGSAWSTEATRSWNNAWTGGCSLFLHSGVVLKADVQRLRQGPEAEWSLNGGLGFWF